MINVSNSTDKHFFESASNGKRQNPCKHFPRLITVIWCHKPTIVRVTAGNGGKSAGIVVFSFPATAVSNQLMPRGLSGVELDTSERVVPCQPISRGSTTIVSRPLLCCQYGEIMTCPSVNVQRRCEHTQSNNNITAELPNILNSKIYAILLNTKDAFDSNWRFGSNYKNTKAIRTLFVLTK